jgi:NADH-quinone oxidoreductase subunit J
MSASVIIFYVIAAFIVSMALLAVTGRKIFRSAIWLLFTLIGIAALYFWMEVPFIAAIQIVVYVGGIVVLIIFSIFLTQKAGDEMPKPIKSRAVMGLLACVFGIAFTYNLVRSYNFAISNNKNFDVSIAAIGMQLLNTTKPGFVLPFEVISMLLLAAMVGCIVIAMKNKPEEK